jgi:hypothetical protein
MSVVFLIADARGFAGEITQVEESCAADDALRDDLDLFDARRMAQEHALDADVERNFSHGKRAAGPGAMALEHDALENLDAVLFAFDDAIVDANGVANAEIREAGAELCRLDFGNFRDGIHVSVSREPLKNGDAA